MSKPQGPPKGKPWLWLTLELIESDAWRALGINSVRFVTFLAREHMRHGGKENGKLKAPQHQLQAYGIGARYITDAIAQCEEIGLVDCVRHGMRTANTYALTWLPTCDGRAPTNRWTAYRNVTLSPLPRAKRRNLPLKGKVGLPLNGKADRVYLPLKGKDLLRSSYQGSSYIRDLSDEELAALAHADGEQA